MASPSLVTGSERKARTEPVLPLREGVWPAPQHGFGDPVAVRPRALIDLSGSLVRVERARLMRSGPWKAVGLRLKGENDALFELFLSAGDGREVVIATIAEEEAIAEWRSLGRATGLPLIMQAPNGEIVEPYPQIGRVALGSCRIRRQYGFLRQRRPRFLTRRKRGVASLGGEPLRAAVLSDGAAR